MLSVDIEYSRICFVYCHCFDYFSNWVITHFSLFIYLQTILFVDGTVQCHLFFSNSRWICLPVQHPMCSLTNRFYFPPSRIDLRQATSTSCMLLLTLPSGVCYWLGRWKASYKSTFLFALRFAAAQSRLFICLFAGTAAWCIHAVYQCYRSSGNFSHVAFIDAYLFSSIVIVRVDSCSGKLLSLLNEHFWHIEKVQLYFCVQYRHLQIT